MGTEDDLRGEELGADPVGRLARSVVTRNDEVAELDARIEARFRQHRDSEIILALPGMGLPLGAESIAATGADLVGLASPALAHRPLPGLRDGLVCRDSEPPPTTFAMHPEYHQPGR